MNFLLELVNWIPFRRGGGLRWSLGAGACLLFYWVLASAAISHHDGPTVGFVLGIEVALVVAVATGIGRDFAFGFIATIASFGIATKGMMILMPWGAPVIVAYDAVLRSREHHAPPPVSRAAWLEARRAQPPALAQGQILTNRVNECAAKYRGNDLIDSYPRHDTAEMFIYCDSLSSSRAGASEPRYSDSDYGWRWRYTPATPDSLGRITQYSVRVFEDRAIGRAAPEYASDANGAIQQFTPAKAPVFVATPIASLQLLHQCIAEIPALRKGDSEVVRKYTYYQNPMDEILHRCPKLQGHLAMTDRVSNYATIAVFAPGRNANIPDTVAVFGVRLIPVDEKQFVFEVSAKSNTTLPTYFMDRAGAIRVRTGEAASADR